MKSFIIPIFCLSLGFLLGKSSNFDHKIAITSASTYFPVHEKNDDNTIEENSHSVVNNSNNIKNSDTTPFITATPILSNLIAFIPDESISSAISLLFNDSDINELDDVSQFASRYLQELSLASSEIDSESFTSLSVSSDQDNNSSGTLLTLKNTAPVYAHFDVSGGLASGSSKILSRWVNLDSNSVLFFDTSHINESSDKNWVSFTPNVGWKSGNYEVTFYKFGSELKKLAHQNFYIEIKENNVIQSD